MRDAELVRVEDAGGIRTEYWLSPCGCVAVKETTDIERIYGYPCKAHEEQVRQ